MDDKTPSPSPHPSYRSYHTLSLAEYVIWRDSWIGREVFVYKTAIAMIGTDEDEWREDGGVWQENVDVCHARN